MDDVQLKKLRELKESYITCFSTDAGKKVLEDLERKSRVHTTTFIPGDIYATIFNEGMRANVLYMRTMINLDVERLAELQAEAER